MNSIIPCKLKAGDEIRVIAPSRSLGIIGAGTREYALQNFEKLGLKVSYSKHSEEQDDFASSSVESRVSDLHDAFADTNIKAIFTAIGGFNSNQLLPYLDYNLIKENPKILSGFSDITALQNAIYSQTGLVTYQGPHFSTLGQKLGLDYTLEYLQRCLFSEEPFELRPSNTWSDDAWYLDQEQRNFMKNQGWWVFNRGTCEASLLGGNLCTFNLLQGTKYFPDIRNSVLFLEDDSMSDIKTFDRDLVSLIQQPSFETVQGLVIGRFQKDSKITHELLEKSLKSKDELHRIPILGNMDFGHTEPRITFPVGGTVFLSVSQEHPQIKINLH